jgi:hypothetical protein
VEEICAVCVLAIGVFAVAAAIGMARVSVTSDSVQETAAAQAQELSDNLVAELSKKSAVPEQIADDVKAVQVDSADGFKASNGAKQFFCDPVQSLDNSGFEGYNITCRVYYNGGKDYIQMKAYASARGNSYSVGSSETPVSKNPESPTYHPTGPVEGIPYLLYGTQCGTNQVAKNPGSPVILEGTRQSAYPVVFSGPVQNAAGRQVRTLSAPSLFFLGGNTGAKLYQNCSFYADSAAQATLRSNFIFIASKTIAFKKNNGDVNDTPELLIASPDSSKPTYLCFANDCKIVQTDSLDYDAGNTKYSDSYRPIRTVKAGLYEVAGSNTGTLPNLFDPKCGLRAVKDPDGVKKQYHVSYIAGSNSKLVSGETQDNAPSGNAAGWTKNGVIRNGTPSTQFGRDVYLYVGSTENWDSNAQTYSANLIALQVVNPGANLVIPANKAVTLQADTVSLCGQKKDDFGSSEDVSYLTQGSAGSRLLIKASKIVVFHTLTVMDSNKHKLYTLEPGTYRNASADRAFDLFNTSDAAGVFQKTG